MENEFFEDLIVNIQSSVSDDLYAEDFLNMVLDAGGISAEEEGFMKGYNMDSY